MGFAVEEYPWGFDPGAGPENAARRGNRILQWRGRPSDQPAELMAVVEERALSGRGIRLGEHRRHRLRQTGADERRLVIGLAQVAEDDRLARLAGEVVRAFGERIGLIARQFVDEIGRASCRDRVGRIVEVRGVAVTLKKKKLIKKLVRTNL